MPEQNGEKSQDPTPHRRQEARKRGQVAKSQDLGSAVILVLGLATLLMFGGRLIDFLGGFTARQLGGQAWLAADPAFAVSLWVGLMQALARCLLPIMGLFLLLAIAINLVQVGVLFVPEKISLDVTRLDPLKGLGRIFSLAGLMRLAFGIFKILVIAAVAFVCLYHERETILGLTSMAIPQIAEYLLELIVWTALKIGVALLVLAILDYAFQRWKFEQDLKMTSQEVREEMKNLEGDPQVAARRRVVQRQLALNRLDQSVPKADVVVTNPTELAIAIQYEPDTMAAPVVVAKGADAIAQRIRKLALENGIPIVERKPLAQALYREVAIDKPIPQERFAAVAEVLAYVYQLQGRKIPGMPDQAA